MLYAALTLWASDNWHLRQWILSAKIYSLTLLLGITYIYLISISYMVFDKSIFSTCTTQNYHIVNPSFISSTQYFGLFSVLSSSLWNKLLSHWSTFNISRGLGCTSYKLERLLQARELTFPRYASKLLHFHTSFPTSIELYEVFQLNAWGCDILKICLWLHVWTPVLHYLFPFNYYIFVWSVSPHVKLYDYCMVSYFSVSLQT